MAALVRILAVRILRSLGSRSRLASRLLVALGVVRWLRSRGVRRATVDLGPGDTLVIGVERGRERRS
jgi:hypothetical protein